MRTILAQLKQYKKDSILTPLFTALEVIMEVMLPFITALIIDEGIQEGNMRKVYTYGGVMIVMAFISLISGAMAGKYAASASSGLACNLRKGVYDKVQDFSFSNIDKFSTAGLVTRMTTDVTNIQNAYQMCIRVAVRAPLMLVCSMVMSFMISPRLSMIFLGAILFLACILGIIMMAARKIAASMTRTAAAYVWEAGMCGNMIWKRSGTPWQWFCRKMYCFPVRFWRICGGEIRMPRKKNAGKPAGRPVPTNS